MKIAIVGSDKFDSMEYHITEELTRQGYTAQIFDYKKIFPSTIDYGISAVSMRYVEFKNSQILKRVLNFDPDLVIGVYRFIHPSFVRSIKDERIKIIHINPDALINFKSQQLFAEPYDTYFTKDPFIENFMSKKLNLNTKLYCEAFNPSLHFMDNIDYKSLEDEVAIDVLSFGSQYPYRNRMLRFLKEQNISITMYGNKAKYFDHFLDENYQNRSIYGLEKSKILNGSKIVFNNLHYSEIESVNKRFFEVNGSGAFQICDYKPILKSLIPIDPKLVSFNSIDEASKLIKYYLNNPEKRYEIRKVLSAYFQEHYTYERMISHIMMNI